MADWSSHGKAAGPMRNQRMLTEEHRLEEPIDLCVAFSHDLAVTRGTGDMVRRARAAGIPVHLIDGEGAVTLFTSGVETVPDQDWGFLDTL